MSERVEPTRSEQVALLPKPKLRGWLHLITLFIAIPASIWLVLSAPSGTPRAAIAVYGITLIGLFAASSAYHRGNWSVRWLRRMRTLDHCMIYLLIAGTNTAFSVLVLHGFIQWLLLVAVWVGAIVGIAFKVIKIEGFARLAGVLYIGMGWIAVAAIPQAISESEALPLLLVAAGGLMYTVGAIVFFLRRPDPRPLVFGYHEIWHTFVVAASACQYAAITLLLRTAH
jgi:hemolysin III